MISNLKFQISNYHKGIFALIISAVIWGIATPILKITLETTPPFSMALLRFILASVFMIPFILKRGVKIKRQHLPKIIRASVFGITLNIGLLFLGASKTSGIHIAIIASLYPIFTAIAATYFLKEKFDKRIATGIALGFIGALLIIGEPLFELTNQEYKIEHIIGDILIVLSTFAWVAYTIENRELDKLNSYNPFEILPISFLVGIISFFPLAVLEFLNNPAWIYQVDTFAKFGIFYYGFFSSFVAYIAFTWGISKTSATTAGLTSYLNPVIAILLSIPLLGEKITPLFTIGALFIAAGLILTEVKHLPSCLNKRIMLK